MNTKKSTTYQEELLKSEKADVNVVKAYVAREVSTFVGTGLTDEQFEEICQLVCDADMCEGASIPMLCQYVQGKIADRIFDETGNDEESNEDEASKCVDYVIEELKDMLPSEMGHHAIIAFGI